MTKKAIASRLLCRTGLRRILHGVAPWSGLLTLNYHRIGEPRGSLLDHAEWSASEQAFAEQVRFCKGAMEMISPSDLPDILSRKRGRYGMITFDDGYRDNYEIALPILRREGVPATFFVTSGFIDHPALSWWDEIAWMVRTSARAELSLLPWFSEPLPLNGERDGVILALLRQYKALPGHATAGYLEAVAHAAGTGRCKDPDGPATWMTWDMLREMKAAGMTIGGHTVSHPVLSRLTPEEQQQEILQCGRRLEQEMGEPMRYFSYPVGNESSFDQHSREILRDAGVTRAFSYYGGYQRFTDWDDFDIKRVAVERELDADWFRSTVTLPQLFA